MTETSEVKLPVWFWVIAVALLIWKLMGAFACYSQLSMTAEQIAALPVAQRDAWLNMPGFAKASYILAVSAGVLGAIALLMRRKLARSLFIISLLGIVIQFGWFFGPYNGLTKLGASAAIFPLVIFLICSFAIWFAGFARGRGWLN